MRFDHLLQSIDIGHCQDQQQRQSMFDLGLFLMAADGNVTEQESDFMHNWLSTIEWTSEQDKNDYYRNTLLKCYAAIKNETVDEFLRHRAKLLIDKDIKKQALQLVKDVALSDGKLDDSELQAINILSDALGNRV